ncbi:MAG: aspartate 1-decarboxylase [Gracilibacteraceae bacterium]|jgi:aspartate 1-decarboxylase|nr:aspartate 1-decarboxylase [Gracilibacteraceae bacterium]
MYRHMMKAKIHNAVVTQAELSYIGSVTIDADLLEQADILPGEKVQIVNKNNGARLETYVIAGERGSGVVCLNGAAARLVQVGDSVIIISYGMYTEEEARKHRPLVLLAGPANKTARLLEGEAAGESV